MGTRKRIAEPVIHILIWLFCYLFFILSVKTIGPFKRIDHTLILPVTLGTFLNIILFYTTALFLIPRFSTNKRPWEFLFLISALLLSLTLIETLTDRAFFVYYYSDSSESFKSQMILNFSLNFIILSLALGYGFTKNWIRNERVKQILEREKLSAELYLLRSQLNPHFLFNVLNMAFSSASRNGDERTADIIEKLSGLMRYTTYESTVEKTELARELDYLQNYIKLQKMRFSEDIPVEINLQVNGDISACMITPLILIQFVENAFKYGVRLETKSVIEISVNVSGQRMEFITRNPVMQNESDNQRKSSGIGIDNVRKRLAILYPGKHSLDIENDGSFFLVRLIMDLD